MTAAIDPADVVAVQAIDAGATSAPLVRVEATWSATIAGRGAM